MKRRFRLNRSGDFERVRRLGKSYAHPLAVLIALRNNTDRIRVGVAAGRSVGGAVQRNRAKRLLRASITPLLPRIQPGWDMVLIARKPLIGARTAELLTALEQLLQRADLLKPSPED